MPNHVFNRLEFDCPQDRLREILEAICYDGNSEEAEFTGVGTIDFNKIIPMPPSLDISMFGTAKRIVEETTAPTIPAENWANKELIRQDRMNGISEKEFSRNLANGKYRLTETFPEPHRDERGRIIIEDYDLYKEDVRKYGVPKAHEWMRQGKYNLSDEELAKRKKRFEEDMERLYKLL